jgi:hypothetical protein
MRWRGGVIDLVNNVIDGVELRQTRELRAIDEIRSADGGRSITEKLVSCRCWRDV